MKIKLSSRGMGLTGIVTGAILLLSWGKKNERPNILLIITDDQGYADFSAYGGADDVQTPHMDRIATNGVRFTNSFASSPISNPSRCAILTGNYQQRWGTYFYGGNELPKDKPTLAEILQKEGYRCVKIGKTHFSKVLDNNIDIKDATIEREFPLNHGYEEFLGFCAPRHDYFKLKHADDNVQDAYDDRMSQHGPLWANKEKKDFEGYTTDIFGDEAVKQIEKNDGRPFFMELAFNAVHHPIYQVPEKYLEKFGLEKFPDWDPEKESFIKYHERTCWKGEIDPVGRLRYLANLACLDDNIGKVLDALEKEGKLENTIIIFISDNGGSQNTYANNGLLSGHKYILKEGGIRTPFVISWPKEIPKGLVKDGLTSHMDIYPTCLKAIGSHATDTLVVDGKNLLPMMVQNTNSGFHESLVWDTGNEWAVRKGDWKLHIVKKDDHYRTIQIDSGMYLYNLKNDLSEKNNLCNSNPEKVQELTKIYLDWKKEMY